MQWIDKGDENTKLFHQSIKARRITNRIHSIQNMQGQWVNSEDMIKEAFVNFYKELLGKELLERCKVENQVIVEGPRITDDTIRIDANYDTH